MQPAVTTPERSSPVARCSTAPWGGPTWWRPSSPKDLAHDQWHSVQRLADASRATRRTSTRRTVSVRSARRRRTTGPSGTIADERRQQPGTHPGRDRPSSTRRSPDSTSSPPTTRTWDRPTRRARRPSTWRCPRRPSRPSCGPASHAASGSSTCGRARCSRPATFAGSLSFDLDGPFVTYVGWLIPWGTPVTLLGETTEQVQAAQRELVRIGIDRPVAQAVGGPVFWADGRGAPRHRSSASTSPSCARIVGGRPGRRTSSTSVSTRSGRRATSSARTTSPSTRCPTGSRRSPRTVPCTCRAAPATAQPRSISLLRSGVPARARQPRPRRRRLDQRRLTPRCPSPQRTAPDREVGLDVARVARRPRAPSSRATREVVDVRGSA